MDKKQIALELAQAQTTLDEFMDKAADIGIDFTDSSLPKINLIIIIAKILDINVYRELTSDCGSLIQVRELVYTSWDAAKSVEEWVDDMVLLSEQLANIN